jgi:hypothetical protein
VAGAAPGAVAPLPEAAAVPWRSRVDARRLRRSGTVWTASQIAHVVPFVATAVVLLVLEPLTIPVALGCLAHAWVIPELYAQRGASVVRRRSDAPEAAERRSAGLLGDLVGHGAREGHARTGLVVERGRLGTWVVGEAGALLVSGAGRRVHCFCVRVDDPRLPSGDRIAHLLLALRADEQGFATVANLTFSGARWRVRRRLDRAMRPALDEAALDSRSSAAR